MRVSLGAAALVLSIVAPMGAADRPVRKQLASDERAAVLELMKAVDLAQETDVVSPVDLAWQTHVLKSIDAAFVPFQLGLGDLADNAKSAAMYVRVISRRDGFRSTDETSGLREWVVKGTPLAPRMGDTVTFGPGEMPIGLATRSSRRGVAAPAEASAVLTLRERQYEREKAAAEKAEHPGDTKHRDPSRFPFEEYYFFDVKESRVERALAVPPGEYDVFVAFVDRRHLKTSTPTVVRHAITVPDFWNLELRLSSLILVSDVRGRNAALPAREQAEHPYTWGRAEVVPSASTTFSRNDVLSVVYQVCNYGAPDSDVIADYSFYHQVNGTRVLFNRTMPQQLSSADLPPAVAWETQGFVMQQVPLQPFPPDSYELDVVVKDRLTRGSATQSIAFTVK